MFLTFDHIWRAPLRWPRHVRELIGMSSRAFDLNYRGPFNGGLARSDLFLSIQRYRAFAIRVARLGRRYFLRRDSESSTIRTLKRGV